MKGITESIGKISLDEIDSYEIDSKPVKMTNKVTMSLDRKSYEQFKESFDILVDIASTDEFLTFYRKRYGIDIRKEQVFEKLVKPLNKCLTSIGDQKRVKKSGDDTSKRINENGYYTK